MVIVVATLGALAHDGNAPSIDDPASGISHRETVTISRGPTVRVEYDDAAWDPWYEDDRPLVQQSWHFRADRSAHVRVVSLDRALTAAGYANEVKQGQMVRGAPAKFVREFDVEFDDRSWHVVEYCNEHTRPPRFEIDYFTATENGHVVVRVLFDVRNAKPHRREIQAFLTGIDVR